MNKEEIISQGYLEAYITNDLTKDEVREVENFLANDEDVRNEFEAISATLERMAFEYGIKPENISKEELMSKVYSDVNKKREFKIIPIAATISFIFISSFFAIYFFIKWQDSKNRLNTALQSIERIAEQKEVIDKTNYDLKQDLNIALSPDYRKVVLKGTENAPDKKVIVYWSAEKQNVYLNTFNLTPLNLSQQYQLWALVDGQPISAGVFDAQDQNLQSLAEVDRVDAFAITIEPKGGSVSPTLSSMQVYGEVKNS